jgi:hypothetical protein
VPEQLTTPVTETKVAGREASPGDVKATERLNRYWTEGAGAAKIRWGVPGDFDRCVTLMSKYIHNPEQAKGHCANLHKRATGGWPGHAPGVEQADASAKKAAEHKSAKVAERAGMSLADVVDLSELGNVDPEDPITVAEADMPEIESEMTFPDGSALLFGADRSMLHRHADGTVELIHGPVTEADLAELPEVAEPEHADLPLTAEAPAEPEGDEQGGDDADEQGGDDEGATHEKTAGTSEEEEPDEGGAGEKAAAAFMPCPRDKGHKGVKDGKCAECGAKLARTGGKSIDPAGLLTALDLVTRGYDDGPVTETKSVFTAARREELANAGVALPDGSFAIETVDELDRAIAAIPGTKGAPRYERVREHLIGRAKELDATDRLPEEWTDTKSLEGKAFPYLAGSVEERQQLLTAALQEAMLPDEDDDADSSNPRRVWVSLDGTFADHVVATITDYSGGTDDSQTYLGPYVIDDTEDGGDGSVTLGTPQAVDKVVSLVPDPDDTGLDRASVPLQGIGLAVKALTETISGGSAPGLKPKQVAQLKTAHAALNAVMSDLGLRLDAEPSTAPDANAGPGAKSLISEAELLAVDALFVDLAD